MLVSSSDQQPDKSSLTNFSNNLMFWLLCLGECSSGICDEAACINSGTCAASKADSYICLCPLGFKGHHCEEGEWILGCLYFFALLFSVGCVFHLEMPEEVSYSYTARREYLLLHLFKSPTETFPFPSKLLWSYIQLLHNLLFSNISGCLS